MPDLDLLKQFQFLLAGFVAAWVFYGLTPYKRPTAFEWVAQALVYTAIVQLTAASLAEVFGLFGWKVAAILPGPASAFPLAICLGVIFAWMANRDYSRTWLRSIERKKQRASDPKFIQRRGLRGFNIYPPPTDPADFPQPTPAPPAPKWHVPVEKQRTSYPKFIQWRRLRGFSNQPMPTHFPQPTPAPPPPKWRVPVEPHKS